MGVIEVNRTWQEFRDNYTVREFFNTRYIRKVHSRSRPGRTNDILHLINGTNEQQKEYVQGLVITSCVLFGVFLVWTLILFGFKCLGRKRVGFLAGYPVQKPKSAHKKCDEPGLEKAQTPVDNGKGANVSTADVDHGIPKNAKEGEETEKEPQTVEEAIRKDDVFFSAVSRQSEVSRQSWVSARQSWVSSTDEFFDPCETSGEIEKEEEDTPMVQVTKEEMSDAPMEQAREQERFNDEPSPVEMNESVNKEVVRTRRLLIATRSIVLFCCVGIIVASVLFLVEGVNALVKTMDNALETIQEVQTIADRGVILIDSFLYHQERIINSSQQFLEMHESWCPKQRDKLLDECRNLTGLENPDMEDCDLSAIPLQVELDDVGSFFSSNSSIVYEEATGLRSDLEEISEIADNLYGSAENWNWAFYVSAAFMVLLDLVVLAIIYGVIQAWREKQTKCYGCLRAAVLVPLLLFFMFSGWLFAILFLIGAMTSADFCIDSPDEPSVAIVEEAEDRFNSIVFSYIIYLIEGCGSVNLVGESLQTQFSLVVGSLNAVHTLVTRTSEASVDEITEACGTDVAPINSIATLIDEQMHVILKLLFQIRVYFSCANFRPLYETSLYDAVCYSGVEGLTWIFSTQLAIAILSMIIVTLRGACKNTEEKVVH